MGTDRRILFPSSFSALGSALISRSITLSQPSRYTDVYAAKCIFCFLSVSYYLSVWTQEKERETSILAIFRWSSPEKTFGESRSVVCGDGKRETPERPPTSHPPPPPTSCLHSSREGEFISLPPLLSFSLPPTLPVANGGAGSHRRPPDQLRTDISPCPPAPHMLSTLHFFSRVLPCLQASTVPSISERSILRAKFEEDLFPTAHPFLVAASAHSWILGCPPFFLPQRGDAQEKKLCSCCRQADPLARRFFRSRGRNLYHGILPANSKFSCHSPFLRLLVFLVCICIGL